MLCGALLHGYSDSFLHTAVPHLCAVCGRVIRGPGHFCGCCESCGTAELVRTRLFARAATPLPKCGPQHTHPPATCVPSALAPGLLAGFMARPPILGLPPAARASGRRLPHFAKGGSPLRHTQSFSQPSQAGCTLCSFEGKAHRAPGPRAGAEARGADAWIPGKQDPWCRHGPLRAPAPACVTPGQVCKAPELGVEETSEVPVPPPGSG